MCIFSNYGLHSGLHSHQQCRRVTFSLHPTFVICRPLKFYLFTYGSGGSSLLCELSLAVASGGYSLVAVSGFLTEVASLISESGLLSAQDSVVVARGPCYSKACGIFPDQESNLCLLHWQGDS